MTKSILILVLLIVLSIYSIILELQNGLEAQDGLVYVNLPRALRFSFVTLIYGYLAFSRYLRFRINTAKIWADPITQRLIQGELTSQGVILFPAKTVTLEWKEFSKIHRLENMYDLVTPSRSMFALPSHFFASVNEWDKGTELIDRKVIEA